MEKELTYELVRLGYGLTGPEAEQHVQMLGEETKGGGNWSKLRASAIWLGFREQLFNCVASASERQPGCDRCCSLAPWIDMIGCGRFERASWCG